MHGQSGHVSFEKVGLVGDRSPVMVMVVWSVTVYVCVPNVNVVGDGQTVV